MTLKDNLPEFISQEKYTKEVLDAIEPEIDKIKLRIAEILVECCISTCTKEGIERFEADYAIQYNAELSLDERRRQIINKMLSKKILTKEALASFIKRNINNRQFYISNMAEDYHFKIMIVDKNYKKELEKALFEARPAYLTFEIALVKYERRCNTFNTSQNN